MNQYSDVEGIGAKNSNLQHASSIHILDKYLVDQIKAGEVIERPSGLLKELLENSLDAGANKIQIHIKNNCLDLLCIEDNGSGMGLNDLPLAFTRHATSKIFEFTDLFKMKSYGFRGEALASIASVAKVTCTSYSLNQNNGGKIVLEGGQRHSLTPWISGTPGTSIFIKDLFYNTPARLKFIRSKISEKNSIKKLLQAFLLVWPEIQFTIKWDDEEKTIFPKVDILNWKERVTNVLFKINKSTTPKLNDFSLTHDKIKVWGYFSEQLASPNTSKKQFIFVNNRYILDKNLHLSICHGLEKYWKNTTGHYVLFIKLPTEYVDVNVHPNKTTIKFETPSLVNSIVYGAVKKKSAELLTEEGIQHQNFPIINRIDRDQSFSQMSGEEISFKENHPLSLKQWNILKKINKQFFILEGDVTIYFFDSSKYFSLSLSNFFFDKSKLKYTKSIPEERIIPLLISSSFHLQESNLSQENVFFTDLKKIGFEVDRISRDKVVVRTIHEFLHCHPDSSQFLNDLFNYFQSKDYKNIQDIENFITSYRGASLWEFPEVLSRKYPEMKEKGDESFQVIFENCLREITVPILEQFFK